MNAEQMTRTMWSALGGAEPLRENVGFTGDGDLPSVYPVTDFASAAVAAAALAVAELVGCAAGRAPAVAVDRRLASLWFGRSVEPVGWTMPGPWGPLAGVYRARDGFIRLHTNAPHHEAVAVRVLGRNTREGVTDAVASWYVHDLETAIVEAGGCAAEMRSLDAWRAHPQGRAVAAEPLIHVETMPGTSPSWAPDPQRPLAGLRVLDLTRVLAGPVASRFLAGYGADVLRIDPPDWDEPGITPDVTLGKRCARLDLRRNADRAIVETLLSQADILTHGYRNGALDKLGYDVAARRALAPALIDVSLDAYGWTGPWAARRGFDSLVQMSAGIAEAGMRWKGAAEPVPLPVQALDHATGYLMAAAAVRAVTRRFTAGEATTARLSLARTAAALTDFGEAPSDAAFAPAAENDFAGGIERTSWGDARRLRPPAAVDGAPVRWEHPASMLGSAAPAWR